MSKFDKIPVYLRKPIFEKLFNIAQYSKLTKEEKDMYDVSLKRRWDNKAAIDFARQEGEEKGVQKGIQQGVQKSKEKIFSIALELKKREMTVTDIAKITGLKIEEIEDLK